MRRWIILVVAQRTWGVPMAYKKNPAIADRGDARDEFVSGVEYVEVIGGGMLRIVFHVNRVIEGCQVPCPAPISLLMPADASANAIGKLMGALERKLSVREDGLLVVCH